MAISTTVVPISDVKLGIKGETTFGALLDSDGTNTTAFRQLPVAQATKPTFNITRESRLLSGRGTVKNAADTVITNKNGTVTCPFDFIATPELLLQHLTMVTQTYNADGSDVYTVEVDGSNNNTELGGSISSGLPHTVNLAYYPKAAEGIKIAGCVVSDLSISGDLANSGGNLGMSGNYFSGFSNIFSSSGTGSLLEDNFTGTWVEPDAGVFFNLGSLSTKQLEVDGANQDMIIKGFNLNIANGVNRVGSDSKGGAEAYAFPEYVVTGDFTIKYDGEFSLAAASNLENSTYEDIFNPTDNTLYDSTDFFTQVWSRTLGPHHEFVLQVDKDDFSPDSFAICRFQQNSLKITQTSPLLYSCSLKLRESW